MAYTVKRFGQILADMIAWIVSHSSQISDVTPGSVIRSFCEATALSIEELSVGVYLGFRRYLDNIQSSVFDFERKAGVKASTNVVFSRAGTSGTVTIPEGTRLKTASGLRFILSNDAQITNGNSSSNPSEVVAEEVGVTYNVGAGTITVIEDPVAGVDSVTNANPAVSGVDQETDAAYKERFQDYIEGLGRSNPAGLRAGALSVGGITSVTVVELFPPVANVNVEVYVDDGSAGGVSTAKVAEVQAVIDGDGTEENPGYRAAGINVLAKKPGVVTQNVVLTAYVVSGVDLTQVDTDIKAAITQYINTLQVGADIIHAELVGAVMGVYGVWDCTVGTPSGNVAVSGTQVGRVGTIAVTMA